MARTRSPNYPTAPLSAAIDSARKLYAKAQQTTLHPEDAQKAMGYQTVSGASRSRIAALRQYGLIEDAKGGVRLTELGLRLIHPTSEDEYQQGLAEAALMPPLFKDLYGSHRTADISVIVPHLIRTRHFSQAGAKQAAEAFRDTMSVIKAAPEGYGSPDAGPRQDANVVEHPVGGQRTPPPPQVRTIQVPLSATAWATVQAPFPLSEEAWGQLIAVLNAMKPGLVARPVVPTGDPSAGTDPEDALRKAIPSG